MIFSGKSTDQSDFTVNPGPTTLLRRENLTSMYLNARGWTQFNWLSEKLARTRNFRFSRTPMSSLVIGDLEMWRYLKAGRSLSDLCGMSLMLLPSILNSFSFLWDRSLKTFLPNQTSH